VSRVSQLDEARLCVLTPLRERLESGAHGQKTALVKQAAQRLHCSAQTVWNDLKALGYRSGRRPRRDYGRSCVSDAEVRQVASIIAVAHRENNKRVMPIEQAMAHARANGLLRAGIGATTMARRMRGLNVHPEQYERAPAHRNMRSDHPNHVWEVDPSLCVLYYLPNGKVGIRRDDDDLLYKNKLENLEALNKRPKVWRYVQWDHYSSAFFFRYYQTPGESAEVLLQFLIDAAAHKPGMAMHGWPDLMLWDKGSANRSAPVKNMLNALGTRHQTHKAHKARVKGGVEGCNNLIETQFEGELAFADIPSVDELNRRADDWQIDFNSLRVHTRHGHTRYGLWQTIREDQLRVCDDAERLRLAANFEPVLRKVNGDLTVSFQGRSYDIAGVDQLSAGDRVPVSMNLYSRESVWAIVPDAKGIERYHACAEVTRDEAGFKSNAIAIGEDYTALADRPADIARKDLREAAWGTRDENEAAAARRKGRVAMDGRVDPFAAVEQRKAQLPQHMQRRSTEIHVPDHVQVEIKPVTHIDAAYWLRDRLARPLTAQDNTRIREWYPDGVPQDELETLAQRLINPEPERPRLSVVGGSN
jgi:hypothetical protein